MKQKNGFPPEFPGSGPEKTKVRGFPRFRVPICGKSAKQTLKPAESIRFVFLVSSLRGFRCLFSGVSVIAELALAGYERQGRSVLAMPSERGIIVSEICRARNGLIAPFDHLGFQRDAEIRISDFESGAYLKNPDLYTPIPRGRIFFCPPEGEPLSLARAKDGMIPDIRAVPGYTPDGVVEFRGCDGSSVCLPAGDVVRYQVACDEPGFLNAVRARMSVYGS